MHDELDLTGRGQRGQAGSHRLPRTVVQIGHWKSSYRSTVGALLFAVAALTAIPPPVPPTTPTGTALAEPPVADSDLLLLPMMMATTTTHDHHGGDDGADNDGVGPFFGVAAASFLEASGRIWLVSLSEQTVIKAVCRTRGRTMSHPALAAGRVGAECPQYCV